MINAFIGYDSAESIAFHVLAHSILGRASQPVACTPIGNEVLPESVWRRPRGPHDSTEFSNARFLVPHLMNYRGWAIFMDCDMVCLGDLAELWAQRDERYAVMVVKHDHRPTETRKFLGAEQSAYARKNWSSLMLLNCGHPACSTLTAEYVNAAQGLDLHGLRWAAEAEIGEIEGPWNVLVTHGYQHPQAFDARDLRLLHYTLGGPWHGYEPEGAHYWLSALRAMLTGLNPCADAVIYQDGPGLLRVRGRYQRREPA